MQVARMLLPHIDLVADIMAASISTPALKLASTLSNALESLAAKYEEDPELMEAAVSLWLCHGW